MLTRQVQRNCLVAVAAMGAVGVAACGLRHSRPEPAAATAVPEPPLKLEPKVLLLNYDPVIASEGGKRLHEVMGWSDPIDLCKQYSADLEAASGGYVRFQQVETLHVDEYPAKKDGFRYTFEELRAVVQGKQEMHQPDALDYARIIEQFKLVERVEKGEIDEVWLQAMPFAGCWESTMVGDGAYECNSDPVENVRCKRLFVIMGFNYERGVGEMLEDMGHRTEAILTHVFGSWDPPKKSHAWDRFTLYDKIAPGEAACGNVHFAPNSTEDYEWGSPVPVMSACDDWLDYPNLSGRKRLVTCADWGSGDIRKHHQWWLGHLPRAAGRTDGKLDNWWCYTVDFNRWPESNGTGPARK